MNVTKQKSAVFIFKEKKPRLCLMSSVTDCGNLPGRRRGICDNCYQVTWDKVIEGKFKWVDVENAGYCLPKKRDAASRILRAIKASRD